MHHESKFLLSSPPLPPQILHLNTHVHTRAHTHTHIHTHAHTLPGGGSWRQMLRELLSLFASGRAALYAAGTSSTIGQPNWPGNVDNINPAYPHHPYHQQQRDPRFLGGSSGSAADGGMIRSESSTTVDSTLSSITATESQPGSSVRGSSASQRAFSAEQQQQQRQLKWKPSTEAAVEGESCALFVCCSLHCLLITCFFGGLCKLSGCSLHCLLNTCFFGGLCKLSGCSRCVVLFSPPCSLYFELNLMLHV